MKYRLFESAAIVVALSATSPRATPPRPPTHRANANEAMAKFLAAANAHDADLAEKSEERRGGNECRSPWSPDHSTTTADDATSPLMGQFGVFQVSFLRQPHFASDEIVSSRARTQNPLPSFLRTGPFGRWLALAPSPILLAQVSEPRTAPPQPQQLPQRQAQTGTPPCTETV